MKRKHARPLVIGTMAMIVLGWMSGLFDRTVEGDAVPLLDIPTEMISAILIQWPHQPEPLRLVKAEVWQFDHDSSTVDQRAVTALLRDLGALELDKALTFDEAAYPTYGLEDSSATKLILSWDGQQYLFFFGKPVPDAAGQYIRFGIDPRMYTTDARIVLPSSVAHWRDKTVLNLDPEGVVRIEFDRPEQTYALQSGSPWQMERGTVNRPVADAAVRFWLQRYHPLRADSLAQQTALEVQSAATYSVTFVQDSGETQRLWYALASDRLYVTDGRDAYQLAVRERLQRLAPPPRDFLDPTNINP